MITFTPDPNPDTRLARQLEMRKRRLLAMSMVHENNAGQHMPSIKMIIGPWYIDMDGCQTRRIWAADGGANG
jgi:hypothetical protein